MRLDKTTNLSELLKYVSEVPDTTLKAQRLKLIADLYPGFLTFLELCFKQPRPYTFRDVLDFAPLKPKVIQVEDRHALPVNALSFISDELPKYSDQSGWKPRMKHSKLLQSLDFMDGEDARILMKALSGVYDYNTKINLLVLKLAFPDRFSLGEG